MEKIRNYKRHFGTGSVADKDRIVCTPDKLRLRHFYVNCRPSMFTTTWLMDMIMNCIKNGHGVAIIDPHGDMVKELLDACPPGSQDNRAAK